MRGPDDLHLGLLPLAVDVGQLMGQLLGPVSWRGTFRSTEGVA